MSGFQGPELIGRRLKEIYVAEMDAALDVINAERNPAVPPVDADPAGLFDITYLRRYYLGGADTSADTPCLLVSEEEPDAPGSMRDAQGGFVKYRFGITVFDMDDGHGYERLETGLWRYQAALVRVVAAHKCEAGYWNDLLFVRPVASPPFPRGEKDSTLCAIKGAEFEVWSLEEF